MSYPSKFVEFFGPCTWKTMHSIAFNYASNPSHPTPEEATAAKSFFNALIYLLPCEACQKHYEKYISETPVDTTSREALSRWVYDLHSSVNKRKHTNNPSFEQVKNDYTGWNRDKMEDMSNLDMESRLIKLADPHFGRPVVQAMEYSVGSFFNSFDSLTGILMAGLVIGGVVYYLNAPMTPLKKSEEITK